MLQSPVGTLVHRGGRPGSVLRVVPRGEVLWVDVLWVDVLWVDVLWVEVT